MEMKRDVRDALMLSMFAAANLNRLLPKASMPRCLRPTAGFWQARLPDFTLDCSGLTEVRCIISPLSSSTTRWRSGRPTAKSVYVYRTGELPLKVQEVDIATGQMKPVRELAPADLGGVVSIAPVITNVDASEFAYSYYQAFSVLYVISGLK